MMAAQRDNSRDSIAVQPNAEILVLPPNSGVIGKFLDETANMFKARTMRMAGLLRRINVSSQRSETLLRTAAQRIEAAEASLDAQFKNQGLLPEKDLSDGFHD